MAASIPKLRLPQSAEMIDLDNFTLSDIPTAETDEYEFKSSLTELKVKLPPKLMAAVSGFGNSGGEVFIAGVDKVGNADDGFPKQVGRQDLCDRADQHIHDVQPTPPYKVTTITDVQGRGRLDPDRCVLVVAIGESFAGPHQAPDHIY